MVRYVPCWRFSELRTCIIADHSEVLDTGLEEAADEVLRDATEAEASHQ